MNPFTRASVLLVATALSCATPPQAPPPPHRELHILLTSDEHGWLKPLTDKKAQMEHGGIVALYERLTRVEGYAPTRKARDSGYVLMSGGDMWTGPFESIVLEGAPVIAAMKTMGYAAVAVGNHEYDFGVPVLEKHAQEAPFPFLAANLIDKSTGQIPTWAKPYAILDVGGLKLGVLGMTNVDSRSTTDPVNLQGLDFRDYEETIDTWVPVIKERGADEIVVLIHEGIEAADSLLPVFRRNHVRAVSFGHHHERAARLDDNGTPELEDDVAMCNGGAFLRGYCRIDLAFEGKKLTSRSVRVELVDTPIGTAVAGDPELTKIVAAADARAEEIGGEVLLENAHLLKRGKEGPLGQLLVDAWLQAFPAANAAVTNAGGLRQDLAEGPVRMRDIVSVLPFNNHLLVVELTGKELKDILANDEAIVGGVRYSYTETKDHRVVTSLADKTGAPIADDAKLRVVTHTFIYRGGDHFQFASYDKDPEDTDIDWREPLFKLLRKMGQDKLALDVVAEPRAVKQ